MLKLKLWYFDHLMQTADSLEKSLTLRKIEGRRRGCQRMRCLDVITDAINLGKFWEIARPGMLQSMGSQRVRHEWVTNNSLRIWRKCKKQSEWKRGILCGTSESQMWSYNWIEIISDNMRAEDTWLNIDVLTEGKASADHSECWWKVKEIKSIIKNLRDIEDRQDNWISEIEKQGPSTKRLPKFQTKVLFLI